MAATITHHCDFCYGPNPQWYYKTPKLSILLPDGSEEWLYDERWSACDECSDLIEKDKLAELLERSLRHNATTEDYRKLAALGPEAVAFHRQFVALVQDKVLKNRSIRYMSFEG